MKARSRGLFEKSLASILAAIEIYNKPDFSYREESFSILAINAWEILFKARILQSERNRISSIFAMERKPLKRGGTSKKWTYKRNRSKNPMTINIFRALELLNQKYGEQIPDSVKKNIEALTEIRDNSIHFYNSDFDLKKKLLELGTATLKNYATLSQKWFGADLSRFNFFIMPLGFVRDLHTAEAINLNQEERKLLKYIDGIQGQTVENEKSDYSLSLEVNLSIKKKGGAKTEVLVTGNPNALEIRLEEEDILDKYPWDYGNLIAYLKNRYSDFKQNADFHIIKRKAEKSKKFCFERKLDPSNENSTTKKFYNPNIVREFDKYYRRKEDQK